MNRRRDPDESGSASLEAVLLLPVLVVTLLAIVQTALFAHASGVAAAAAREATRTARLTGDPGAGRQRASDFLAAHGAQVVLDPVVDASTRGGVASVRISGHAVKLLPLFVLPISASSSGPIESFSPIAGVTR
ncbi:MAG TPA: TadE/TadG family type IV pilus assembly protein [Acidimicrobiia bacterium]|nr:TadE/TadG family type IV pilus assembly protein [Acidimicrobiia bacterium]